MNTPINKANVTSQSVRRGSRLPYFKEGRDKPTIHSASDMNRIVATCNAFLNMRVVRGTRDDFLISENDSLLQLTDPIVDQETTPPASSAGMFPFRIYHPTSSADPTFSSLNTFRVHGGYAHIPELFPTALTPRIIQPELTHKLQPIIGTDGVQDNSDSEGSSVNDIVLDNWDNGAGGAFATCGIWLEITQSVDRPGFITTSVNHAFDYLPACFTKHLFGDTQDTTTMIVPVGFITRTSLSEDLDLLSSTITQLLHTQVVRDSQINAFNHTFYEYRAQRVYLPGDVVLGTDGNYWLNVSDVATIGHDPIISAEFIRINQ